MKITAFIGSARKKYTYNTTELFLQKIHSLGDIEYEIVRLSDYNLHTCKGCKLCLDKGEEFCPLKDDRDKLIQKITQSDGIIFASPVYTFQVSALMKKFLDRIAFYGHRPLFFGKTYTSIVAQGIYGGKDTVKYLDFVGDSLGFNVVKGCYIKTLEPLTEEGKKNIEKKMDTQSKRFYTQLMKQEYPSPSLSKLMIFRLSRTSIKKMLNEDYRDYRYYKESGWFESNYYYPVKLSLFKKLTGRIFDIMSSRMASSN